ALWRAGTISHLFSIRYDGGGTGRVSGGEGKFIAVEDGFSTHESKICRH
ncbi:hypothetical protein SEEH4316_15017, partial [Salmonella enterica subsp. enterica serovar Heidelberg str. RI-11-014316]